MRIRRVVSMLASITLATIVACGHKGEEQDPATAASADDSASASASTSATASEGDAPTMDDTADDGSCAGPNCIRRCDSKGRPADCGAAGEALRTGADGVTQDSARAMKYLEKACGLKDKNGCFQLAGMVIKGEGVHADVARGVVLLGTACDLGRGEACVDLAGRAEDGDGMAKDHQKSIAYLAIGCIADDFQQGACESLADAAGKKDKGAQKFIADWKKSCKATKDASACAAVERTKKR